MRVRLVDSQRIGISCGNPRCVICIRLTKLASVLLKWLAVFLLKTAEQIVDCERFRTAFVALESRNDEYTRWCEFSEPYDIHLKPNEKVFRGNHVRIHHQKHVRLHQLDS